MPTPKQRKAAEKLVENGGKSISRVMREVGYSAETAKSPKKLTDSKGWEELMAQYLPDADVAKVHQELLHATTVDHMVFPLNVTDEEITELLADANCTVRKFMHSETQTHVWFWSADNAARKAAVELAYKLKGRLTQKVEMDVRDVTSALDTLETDYQDVADRANEELG